MAEAKDVQKKQNEVKVKAAFPPFNVVPTGQVVGAEPTVVAVDGWIQANIDKGLLVVCS